MSKIRKWNESYVQFGFTCTETVEGLQKPQCMLCNIVFSNSNLKPSKLQEHFNKRHGGADISGHDFESLKSKRIRYESRGTLPKFGFVSAGKPLLLASDHVAYNVAKSKQPHTIAEELIKPCVLQMTEDVLGKDKVLFKIILHE